MTTHRKPDCFICRQQAGKERPPPGGYIYKGRYFVVCHAGVSPGLDMGTKGTLLVESRRHFLDFGEMAPDEGTELTKVLKMLFPAVKRETGAERLYSLAMMDGVPHFHMWLVPHRKEERLKGVRYLARPMEEPSSGEIEKLVDVIKKAIDREAPPRQTPAVQVS
jgi:diadenosine tetraphosphate (Ap4A) HIT family hydrolase